MTRHYREHMAQVAFERHARRLRDELALGTPRRHLDVLVELLERLLADCGSTLLTDGYRRELAELGRLVSTRSHDRIVAQRPNHLRLIQ